MTLLLEHRKNLSIAHKGKPRGGNPANWKHTEEAKLKMSNASKGVPWSQKRRDNYKSKPCSEETKRKISESHKGKPSGMLGKIFSAESRKKMSIAHKGEKSHLWRGGITAKNDEIRNGVEFRLWREAVFARDGWTCQKTGITGCRLEPHHIKNFSLYPELRFAIDNGITLSKESHDEFHKRFGNKNNTKGQINGFLSENN